MAKFDNLITTPFASSGDKMNIPVTAGDGSINLTDGFGVKYQTAIEDGGLYIPRNGVNAVFYLSQAAIKELQEKVPLSVNGVLPDADGNISLQGTEFPSLITNADGVYQKYQGNSITWGNSDFSKIYSKIISDTAAFSITAAGIHIFSNSPGAFYPLNVSGGIALDGYLKIGTAGYFTPYNNVGLGFSGCLGIKTAPDSAYALKVGGNSKFDGNISCFSELYIENLNAQSFPQLIISSSAQSWGLVLYPDGNELGIHDYTGGGSDPCSFTASGTVFNKNVGIKNAINPNYSLAVSGPSVHSGRVFITDNPSADPGTDVLAVSGTSYFMNHVGILDRAKAGAALYVNGAVQTTGPVGIGTAPDPIFGMVSKTSVKVPQTMYSTGDYGAYMDFASEGKNLRMVTYPAGGSYCLFQLNPDKLSAHFYNTAGGVGINTNPDSAYALKVGGAVKITGGLDVDGNIKGIISGAYFQNGIIPTPVVARNSTLSYLEIISRLLGSVAGVGDSLLYPIVMTIPNFSNGAFLVGFIGHDGTEFVIYYPNGTKSSFGTNTSNTATVSANLYRFLSH